MRLRLTDAIVASVMGRAEGGAIADQLREHCFDKQTAVIESPEPTLILQCGRRAGKTVVILLLLLLAALANPGEIALYVMWRRAQIRTTIWAEAKRLKKRYGMPLEFREIDRQFYIHVPGGGVVWLTGCDDEAEVEKFRGARFSIAIVDEMGSYGEYLQRMVEDAIEPALSDLGGRLIASGTPGIVPHGYWYAIATGDDEELQAWPSLDWTCLDNPHHDSSEWIRRVTLEGLLEQWPGIDPDKDTLARDGDHVLVPGPRLAKRGWGPNHPTFLREWCNRWVIDRDALAYPFERDRNFVDRLPEGEFLWVLGVDLGASADKPTTAFVLIAYQRDLPMKYIVRCEKRSGQTPNQIGARIEWYRERWHIHTAVVDTGGLGGAYVQQFVEDGIPAEPAEKRQKLAYHEWCRGDILSGALLIVTGDNPGWRELVDEAAAVTVEDLVEDTGVDHLLDGLLYAWRKARAAYRPEKEDPKPGDQEYNAWERKLRKAQAAKRVREKMNKKRRWS